MTAPRPSKALYALVAVLLILLPLLAVLQYRWIGEVSQAERRRLEDSLNRSSTQFAEDFDRELMRAMTTFQVRGSMATLDLTQRFVERYEEWSLSSSPALIHHLYVARPSAAGLELLRFEPGSASMETMDWPENFHALQQNLQARLERTGDRRQPFGALIERTNSAYPLFAVPAMPDVGPPRGGGFGPGRQPPPAPAGWTIIEIDEKSLFDNFIPTLIARHFGPSNNSDYRIAIVSNQSPARVIYKSGPDFSDGDVASPDLRIPLLGPEAVRNRAPGGSGRPPGSQFSRGQRPQGPGFGPPGAMRAGLLIPNGWDLLVKHRAGSLDSVVSSLRYRNLAVSFGILLLLFSSVALVIISSQRARALAHLQMDFVARVSHELRTPLAIIRSAAYNVAHGIVSDEKDVREYAQMVQTEGQRLSTMVDQILTFSRTESGEARYDLQAISIPDVVDRVVHTMASALAASGSDLHKEIPDSLPEVRADERALAECLQNVLNNAIKYGRTGAGARIRIEARKSDPHSVALTVEDSGPGIEPSDLPHIFEPFFRGKNARSDTPGSGLGLNLVRRLMNAQGGKVTVESEPGRGARFTLYMKSVESSS